MYKLCKRTEYTNRYGGWKLSGNRISKSIRLRPGNRITIAHTGPTVTKCCGDPIIVSGEKPCPGKKNGACAFTISQTICVEVPVNFGATATVGDTYVDCLNASTDDICTNCKEGD